MAGRSWGRVRPRPQGEGTAGLPGQSWLSVPELPWGVVRQEEGPYTRKGPRFPRGPLKGRWFSSAPEGPLVAVCVSGECQRIRHWAGSGKSGPILYSPHLGVHGPGLRELRAQPPWVRDHNPATQ